MTLLIVFALAAATGPVPVTPLTSWTDYPMSSLRADEQGVVGFEVAVTADGKPTECRVTASSGFPSLDNENCRQIVRRGRFHPATNEAGTPQADTYSSSLKWTLEAQ